MILGTLLFNSNSAPMPWLMYRRQNAWGKWWQGGSKLSYYKATGKVRL